MEDFLLACFFRSEEVRLIMPVSLFYACLHGSVVELPRICGMFWKCVGDIGFLFLAYQVGLNVVTLRPVLDRTN